MIVIWKGLFVLVETISNAKNLHQAKKIDEWINEMLQIVCQYECVYNKLERYWNVKKDKNHICTTIEQCKMMAKGGGGLGHKSVWPDRKDGERESMGRCADDDNDMMRQRKSKFK